MFVLQPCSLSKFFDYFDPLHLHLISERLSVSTLPLKSLNLWWIKTVTYTFFLIFRFFPWFYWVKTPVKMMNRCGESGILILFLILVRKYQSFPTEYNVNCRIVLVLDDIYQIETLLTLLRVSRIYSFY